MLDADDVVRRGETDERVLPLPVAVDVNFAVVAANLEQVESLAHAVVAVVRSQRVAGEPARLLVIVEELPSGENPEWCSRSFETMTMSVSSPGG